MLGWVIGEDERRDAFRWSQTREHSQRGLLGAIQGDSQWQVQGLLIIFLWEFLLHLNALLSHGNFLLRNNFWERVIFDWISNALNPQISFLLRSSRHSERGKHDLENISKNNGKGGTELLIKVQQRRACWKSILSAIRSLLDHRKLIN